MGNGVRNSLLSSSDLAADDATTPFSWNGGTGTVTGFGTFGSGTLVAAASPDGTNYKTILSMTSFDWQNFTLGKGWLIKFTLTGSTNPALTCQIWDCQPLNQSGI